MTPDAQVVWRAERALADHCAAVAEALGATSLPVADGVAVLMGPGFYVNRAMCLGSQGPVDVEAILELERASAAVGVPPAIDACPWAHPSLLEVAGQRQFRVSFPLTVLAKALSGGEPRPAGALEVRDVRHSDLGAWQQTAALGFGYTSPEQHAISDAFIDAAAQVPGTHLLLGSMHGQPVATGSVVCAQGVASLGGMCTVPTARRQGAQAAMIQHRLHLAAEAGCELAICQAAPGSGSERNLLRAGFGVLYTQVRLVRSEVSTPDAGQAAKA